MSGTLFGKRFVDEASHQVGRIQQAVGSAALAGLSILIGYRVIIGHMGLVLPLLAICAVILASLVLVRMGHLKWSGSLLSWTLLGFVVYLLQAGDGIHDVAIAAVPAVLVIAALVLNRRYFYLFTIVSLLSIAAVGSPEIAGIFRTFHGQETNRKDTIDLLIILGITTVTVRALSESLMRSLIKARTAEKELRVQAEQMSESARRYQTLFEGANDAILIIDGDKFIDCNTKAIEMFGCRDRQDILNSSPWDLSPMHQPDGFKSEERAQRILELANNGVPQSFQWKHSRKDGSLFDADVSLSSMELAGGRVIQALVRDITEKREAAERIIRSERYYRTLVNTSPDAISIADMDGRLSFVSPKALEVFGVPEGVTVLGKSILDWVAPEDREKAANRVRLLLSGQLATSESEFKLLRYDGSPLWAELTSSHLLDSDGSIGGILMICRDITRRKESERALQESEELHRCLIAAVPDVIIRTDLDGNILFINETNFDIIGYVPDERILGRNILSFIVPEDRDRAVVHMQSMMQRQQGLHEYRLRFRDEVEIDCEVNGDVLRDGSENPIGMVFVVRNISKRKMEEAVRKKLEEQLIHGQKLESIGTLAAGVAHDFNNILSIIMGNVTLLANNRGSEEKFAKRLDAIELATGRGAQVVKQLLTYARKAKIVQQTVEIGSLIDEVAGLLEATLPKSIEVLVRCAADVPSISGDMNQIHQVLLNLGVNARDAMPGGGQLSIDCQSTAADCVRAKFPGASARQYVKISVTDTGIGMDDETRGRIFDPFFTTKGVGKGTGLGLAMVHGIIENHLGFIEVESRLGEGTEFSIYLPAAEQESESGKDAGIEFDSIPGGRETILLVEDEQMAREFLNDVLTLKGYRVVSAADGEEGMKMFERYAHHLALIIADVDLPKLNGEELCRRVKQVRPDIPLLVVSGCVDLEKRTALGAIGVEEIRDKPLKIEEMLLGIRSILDRRDAGVRVHHEKGRRLDHGPSSGTAPESPHFGKIPGMAD